MSSKSPHSPGFDYRPPSSHTSATSSILFSSAKPQSVAKRANPLGFDFGLADAQAPQVPPSPTSTVYEAIDSPTVPDFLLAGDESATVDLVRNHLRRPSTAHTQVAPNFHEDQYPVHRRKRSKDSWTAKTQTVFQVEDAERDSDFWDDHSGVFSYYGEAAPNEGLDEEQVMGEEWTQPRQIEQQTPRSVQNPATDPSKSTSPKTPKASRRSPLDDITPSKAPLNVTTKVSILRSPATSPIQQHSASSRDSDESMVLSSIPYKLHSSNQHQPGETMGYGGGYEAASVQQTMRKQSSTSTKGSRQGSLSDRSSRSRSSDTRSPGGSAIRTNPRYITPEMPPTAVFPNTPPASVSPRQDELATKANIPQQPDQSLTPPSSNNERKPPTQNVIKALKDRTISEPKLISMTATVPTVPIIRMGDDRLEQLRNERRKTRMASKTSTPERKTRRPMLDDEVDDHVTSPPPFTRQNRSSPPGVATRGQVRRRETTAGSVLFDDQLRDRAPSPSSSKLLAGPEYTTYLPSPHLMADNPYQQGPQKSRHRRKVSRQDIDPVITHSSPAILNQWDGHPKRRMNGPIDPAW
jgi:hypothetical protein